MLVVYGFYRFFQKHVAYRNDFCLTCNSERVTQQWRSFNCGHIFYIPILPFGIYRRWLCPVCKSNPHARVTSSQGFKVVAAVLFGFFTLFFLVAGISTLLDPPKSPQNQQIDPDLPVFFLVGSVVLGVVTALLIRWCLHREEPVNLKATLAELKPLPTDTCFYCKSSLDNTGFCAACQLRRTELILSKP